MALQTCPAPPAPGERHRTVQFSPRVAFLWVAGKAQAVGGASHCVLGSKAAGCGPPTPQHRQVLPPEEVLVFTGNAGQGWEVGGGGLEDVSWPGWRG